MKVLITGAGGMLGSSFCQSWQSIRPHDQIIQLRRQDADLTNKSETFDFISAHKPDLIIHTAAHVDGIASKLSHPTEYLMDNLIIDTSVFGAAISNKVSKFIYIGSAAEYPVESQQPLVTDSILGGPLEEVNEGYALAKICGTKICEYVSKEFDYSYRTLILSNLYGPGDNFSESSGHLIAAALAKVDRARTEGSIEVDIWGDGLSRREFTLSHDVTEWVASSVEEMQSWPPVMNVGAGQDFAIDDFYLTAKQVVGYSGKFIHDKSKPSGMRQRLLDSSVAQSFGWKAKTSLFDGMLATYKSMISAEN